MDNVTCSDQVVDESNSRKEVQAWQEAELYEPKTFEQSLRSVDLLPLALVQSNLLSPRQLTMPPSMQQQQQQRQKDALASPKQKRAKKKTQIPPTLKIKSSIQTSKKAVTQRIGSTMQTSSSATSTPPKSTHTKTEEEETNNKNINKALRAIFLEADSDHNGHLNVTELHSMLTNVTSVSTKTVTQETKKQVPSSFSMSDATRILSAFDLDGNGTVEEGEFIDWVVTGLTRTTEERTAFAKRSVLAHKLDSFLTSIFNRAQTWNARVSQKTTQLKHSAGKKSGKKLSPKKKIRSFPGIRAMFQEYDTNSTGSLNLRELSTLLHKTLERGGVVIASDFTKSDCSRVLDAFDEGK